jgi:uncharacterized membrane protein YkvA (DUF1232 family)
LFYLISVISFETMTVKNKINLDRYRRFFSERNFWSIIGRFAQRLGIKTVYSALLMYYAYRRKDTPFWAKNIVIGVLGYLLAPLDFMPDLTPIIGFTDDIGMLSFGLVTIAAYINQDVRGQARARLAKWFPKFVESDLQEVERKL